MQIKIIFVSVLVLLITGLIGSFVYKDVIMTNFSEIKKEGNVVEKKVEDVSISDQKIKKDIETEVIEGSVLLIDKNSLKIISADKNEKSFAFTENISVYEFDEKMVIKKSVSDINKGSEIFLEYDIYSNNILSIKIK